jgi:trimethylamine--corrinoid protein Co-methyltransferase
MKVTRPYELLSRNDLYEIHMASLRVLENIGVDIFDQEVVGILNQAGAHVGRDRRHVFLPSHIIEAALRKAPKSVTLCGRNPVYDMRLEDKRVHITTGSEAPNIYDLYSGERREATKQDMADLARLADGLRYCGVVPLFTPRDVFQPVYSQHSYQMLVENTEKHCPLVEPLNLEGARDLIMMAETVVGGSEELLKRPIFSCQCECTSPLQWWPHDLGILVEFARRGLPVGVGSSPVSGATGPATMAGMLVLMFAETLSGLVIAQQVNPGTPSILCLSGSIMDMKTTNDSWGCPEEGLLAIGTAQMSRYYGLPCLIVGGYSDSKLYDAQAGYESAMTAVAAILSGGNLLVGGGMLDYTMAGSLDAVAADEEIYRAAMRIAKGIDVSDETLALDVVRNVGSGGNFLAQKHTRDFHRRDHFLPELTDREVYATWKQKGSTSMVARAKERVKEILRTHVPAPLDRDVQETLARIVKGAEQREMKGGPQKDCL